jgi:hypothetical protein
MSCNRPEPAGKADNATSTTFRASAHQVPVRSVKDDIWSSAVLSESALKCRSSIPSAIGERRRGDLRPAGVSLAGPALATQTLLAETAGVEAQDAGSASSGTLNTARRPGAAIGDAPIGVNRYGALPSGQNPAAHLRDGLAQAMAKILWKTATVGVLSVGAILLFPRRLRPHVEAAMGAHRDTRDDG